MTPECQTLTIPEVAAMLGVSAPTLYRQIRKTGEVAPGVPVLDFGPQTKRASRVQVERLLKGDAA